MTGSTWRRLGLLGPLIGAQFLLVLSFQAVALGLPAIQAGLALSPAGLDWVVNAKVLTLGGSLLLGGQLADRLGPRRLLLAGLATLAVATLLGGIAPTLLVLVAARALEGLGAGLVSPAVLALLVRTCEADADRTTALAVWGAAGPLGGIVGTLVGGSVVDGPGWRWLFLLSAGLASATLGAAWRTLPDLSPARRCAGLDVRGAVAGTLALGLLLLGLEALASGGPGGAWPPLSGALALAGVFAWSTRRASQPLVPGRVLGTPNVALAALVTLVFAAASNTPIFLYGQFMQQVRHASPLLTGWLFLPCNVAIIAGSAGVARLARRLDAARAAALGLAALVVALLWLARLSPRASYLTDLLPGLLLVGLGLGACQVGTLAAATRQVPTDEQGLVAGLLNTAAQVGTAIGLALLEATAAARTLALGQQGVAPPAALSGGLGAAFLVGAGLASLGVLLALRLRCQPRPGEAAAAGAVATSVDRERRRAGMELDGAGRGAAGIDLACSPNR